jgi:hypothetical protein
MSHQHEDQDQNLVSFENELQVIKKIKKVQRLFEHVQ